MFEVEYGQPLRGSYTYFFPIMESSFSEFISLLSDVRGLYVYGEWGMDSGQRCTRTNYSHLRRWALCIDALTNVNFGLTSITITCMSISI